MENRRRFHVAKKDGTLTKTHVETEVENCSCSLCPTDVNDQKIVHDFNSLVNNTIPFCEMVSTEFMLHGVWLEPRMSTEQPWKTNLRRRCEREEREAIKRLGFDSYY